MLFFCMVKLNSDVDVFNWKVHVLSMQFLDEGVEGMCPDFLFPFSLSCLLNISFTQVDHLNYYLCTYVTVSYVLCVSMET